jgi:hypothetical protein
VGESSEKGVKRRRRPFEIAAGFTDRHLVLGVKYIVVIAL